MKIRIKVVPNDKPNDEGSWHTIDTSLNPMAERSWVQTSRALEHYISPGYHLVAVERAKS
jgi:hypothetical protein